MSSYENRYGTSEGSRHSNTLARLAFNIYGNSGSNNSSSISPSRVPTPYASSSRQSPPTVTPYHDPSELQDSKQVKFKSSQELTSLSMLNNDAMDNSVVIAGKNLLQILKVDSNGITPVNDLLSSTYYMKNKKIIGSILDVEAGYHNYSKFIATSTTTGSIFIFNNTSQSKNKLVFKYSDHTRAVNKISFSQLDSHSLLSGSQDGAMKLWDLRSNLTRPVFTMQGNSDAVRSLKFSPFHNKKFCAIFDSGVIQKWDLRVPTQFERKFNAHTGPGLSLDWHPELDYIVSGGRDKQIQVWNMNNNDSRQIPEHVIYTAAPVNKVRFRPNANGITNISNAEIATNFLTNELSTQIYSLKRKYIPEYIVESHSAQITGLAFKDERIMLTCSKDKFLIKEDLNTYYHPIDNLPTISTSWSANNDLIFLDQEIMPPTAVEAVSQQQHQHQPHHHQQQQNASSVFIGPSSTPAPASQHPAFTPITSLTSTSPNSPVNSASNTAVTTPSVTSFPDLSPRPGNSRSSSSYRPHFHRMSSQGSHNNIHHPHNTSNFTNPYIVPISLPISKPDETLKYLAENYIFDPSSNLIETCVENSLISNEAGCLRDSQTWKVIKEALVWEQQLSEELKYEHETSSNAHRTSVGDASTYQSDNDRDYQYSTSNSTNYGKSPVLSDLSEFNSLNSKEMSYKSRDDLKISKLKGQSFDEINEDDEINSENDTTLKSNNDQNNENEDKERTITKDDMLKWDDLPVKEPLKRPTPEETPTPEEDSALEFVETSAATTRPISLPEKRRPRSSILESLLPSNSQESSHRIGKSSSPSYSISSSFSNTSNSLRPIPQSLAPLLHKSNFNKLSKQESHKSELTRQLTNQKHEEEAALQDSIDKKLALPPFAPKYLIKKAIEFSLQQGDLIMAGSMILLFNDRYKLYSEDSTKDILFAYIEYLQRLQFFLVVSKIISISNIQEFKDMSSNFTTLRRFCHSCGVLIVNENLKERYMKDPMIKFGTWYCENCLDRTLCCYCNEPLKGLTIFKLSCGHTGHFGCFKTWMIDEEMNECPAGCSL